jgi:hypothetical protein
MENSCKTTYKGHSLCGSAHKESAGTVEKWRPDNPCVDDQVVIFDPLKFPNGKFDTEEDAVQHSIKYGEWIVDHPLALESTRAEEDEDDEEDEEDEDDEEDKEKESGERLI